jgi:hypothetical protein
MIFIFAILPHTVFPYTTTLFKHANMMQLMTTHLEGQYPLQRIILNYCLSLGTPTCNAMKPLIKSTQNRIHAEPDKPEDEMTAWRCKPKQTMCKLGECSFNSFVLIMELEVLRLNSVWENADPALLEEKASILGLVQNSNLKMKYDSLFKKETNGTPSAVCIRNYINNYKKRVPLVFETMTLWYYRHSIFNHMQNIPLAIKAEFDAILAYYVEMYHDNTKYCTLM